MSGFVFETLQQLIDCTVVLMTDTARWTDMSQKSIERSRQFGMDKFEERLDEILEH